MPSLKQITQELLASINRRPQKRLGQNFLIDPTILRRIVDTADIKPEDTIIEIGTGLAILTKELADRAKKVITIEIDQELLKLSKEILAKYNNIDYILGDILKIDYQKVIQGLKNYKIVANLPYYITAPIMEKILDVDNPPALAVLTVQKEVVERMASKPGSKIYGSFSVFCQFYGEVKLISLIQKFAFFPQPEVSSAIVKITPHTKPFLTGAAKEKFFDVMHAAFQQRRKTLSNSLKEFNIQNWPVDPMRRPETLSLEEFIGIAAACYNHGVQK
ncbi:MAG: ribosomal RNA small subunit methyltransferase A [Candidatus Margulisbacteria bacterium]|nr:ribosomal RNA small subunit methyltransferase A [Candidatus Margulisiibacteriota bacterium]MBU1022386.1 ribosomal RNA small subunit methyltransferase A [Candidatus Margulisiibacteriota bacterium]MBU1729062.1 ribosomal RNA small subunit methyltransferase A [Candidatus Margulisiibacteriota bacterium]MBU1954517.1 ribosomal RNA small subunit methyltransferase A [Candidatus Margulisiibacteriota bacterium]